MPDDELVPLNFAIPRSLKERLQAYARRHHISVTVVVRQLLPGALTRAERADRRDEEGRGSGA